MKFSRQLDIDLALNHSSRLARSSSRYGRLPSSLPSAAYRIAQSSSLLITFLSLPTDALSISPCLLIIFSLPTHCWKTVCAQNYRIAWRFYRARSRLITTVALQRIGLARFLQNNKIILIDFSSPSVSSNSHVHRKWFLELKFSAGRLRLRNHFVAWNSKILFDEIKIFWINYRAGGFHYQG